MNLKRAEKSIKDVWVKAWEGLAVAPWVSKTFYWLKERWPYGILGVSTVLVLLPLASWIMLLTPYLKPVPSQDPYVEYFPLEEDSYLAPKAENFPGGMVTLGEEAELPAVTEAANQGPETASPALLKEEGAAIEAELKEGPPRIGALAWPLEGQVVTPYAQVFSPVFEDYRFHRGVDLTPQGDDRVRAVWGGQVAEVTETKDYGLTVRIDHGEGWQSVYSHLKEVRVKAGQNVAAEEVLGRVGEPGLYEAGPPLKLHFELHNAQGQINPIPYLKPGE